MMNDVRMKEFAEKFASELKDRIDNDELMEIAHDLDMSEEEMSYFGWEKEVKEPFTCKMCPYYYEDWNDERDEPLTPKYCHYDGLEMYAPCSCEEDFEEESFDEDYE